MKTTRVFLAAAGAGAAAVGGDPKAMCAAGSPARRTHCGAAMRGTRTTTFEAPGVRRVPRAAAAQDTHNR